MSYNLILTRRETGASWQYYESFSSLEEARKKAKEWDVFFECNYVWKSNMHGLQYKVYEHEHTAIWSAKIINS